MQDFLILTIADADFHHGGKIIMKATHKNNIEVPLITFVCQRGLPPTQRENIHKY